MRALLVCYGLGISRVSPLEFPDQEPTVVDCNLLMNSVIGSNRYFEYVMDSKTGSAIFMTEDGLEPTKFELSQLEDDKDIICRAVLVHGSRRFKTRLRKLLSQLT